MATAKLVSSLLDLVEVLLFASPLELPSSLGWDDPLACDIQKGRVASWHIPLCPCVGEMR